MDPDSTKRILIDDRGREWDARSNELRDHFESALGPDALSTFLVTNLGWIEIVESRGSLRVSCRPRIVSGIALAQLGYFIGDRPCARLSVRVLAEDWTTHAVRGLSQAMLLIAAMQSEVDQSNASLVSRELPFGNSRLFDRIVDVLAEIDGEPTATLDDLDDSLTHKIANQRWSISHFEDGRLVTDRLGNGFTPFNQQWNTRKPDSQLSNYADSAYADWVCGLRKRVYDSNVAVFDDVDAVVQFPKIGTTRLVYTRATAALTFGRGRGRRYVISAAESISSGS